MTGPKTLLLTAALLGLAGAAFAQDADEAAVRAHEARVHHMQLNAFSLAPLGAMAQGEMPFDAELAAAKASNIAALARLDQTGYWVEGSDSESLEDSRALPVIWEDLAEVQGRFDELATAAEATAAAAAEGQEAFAAAFGELGGTCGSCHEDFREPQ